MPGGAVIEIIVVYTRGLVPYPDILDGVVDAYVGEPEPDQAVVCVGQALLADYHCQGYVCSKARRLGHVYGVVKDVAYDPRTT